MRPSRLATHPRIILATLVLLGGNALPATAELALQDFWIRAMPPGQSMTAAYGKITNTGESPEDITVASLPFAQRIEFHKSVEHEGAMRMQAITDLTLAPGQTLTLMPGGAHMMVMGVDDMPEEGERFDLCVDSTAGQQCSSAPVMKQGPMPDHSHHAH